MKSDIVGNVQLVAGSGTVLPQIFALLKDEGIKTRANPDVYVRTYRSFGVDEARELREKAATRAVSQSRRVFVVVTPSMTAEAQNALLKTIEEAPGNALFFFVVPSTQALLATFRSRAQVLRFDDVREAAPDTEAFLAASPQKRLDMLKPLLEKDDDDKRDLGKILVFLASLEHTLSAQKNLSVQSLEALYRTRAYIGDRGALVKPLLEQLALLSPRV